VSNLPHSYYANAIHKVLRETLRLCSTIPAFGVEAKEDTLLGGKYPVKAGEPIVCLLAKAHLDPLVYGNDSSEFKPERMLDENFERLQKQYPNSWKPFGNGLRACIGRPFAWQEALLAMAMMLQNFNFVLDDPSYQLRIAESLTIKPKEFYMRASLRNGMTPLELENRLAGTSPPPLKREISEEKSANAQSMKTTQPSGKPLRIYYGSNSGTCEALAQRLAADAASHGFHPSVVDILDTAKENLPKDEPVVIITASYEGQPPDNAAHFIAWIESLKGKEMENVSYAVFGCGKFSI
jgi:cytochrome P450 / NADPH-cytochrome P450 reductase